MSSRVYVMTRDAVKPMEPAPFRVSIQGLKGTRTRYYDPHTGKELPLEAKFPEDGTLQATLVVTDYPRLLSIER